MIKTLTIFIILSKICFAFPEWIQEVLNKNKNVQVHNDASALIYLNDCELTISSNGSADSRYRKIIKLLKEDAIFINTLFSLPTTSSSNVNNFEAWIIRTDGTDEKIDEDALISLGTQKSSAYFDDDQLIFGILPRIGIGSIIAFEYEIEEKGEASNFQEFVFHYQQPVVSSKLTVEVPDGWDVNYANLWSNKIQHSRDQNIFSWWCNNLEYEADESLTPPSMFLQKRILLNCYNKEQNDKNHFSTWDKVGQWGNNYFIEPTRSDSTIRNLTNLLIKNCKSNEEKISAVAGFVQNEIRYVAIEIGKNKWIPRNAVTTLNNRYGDCKDKTALMISMLSILDIESYPVLVGSQKPIFIDIPSPYQFNHVIVAIPVKYIENNVHLGKAVYKECLLFDPTNPEINLGELPISLYYSGALIGSSNYPDFFYLDKTSPLDFMQSFECAAVLDSSGNLNSEIQIKYFNAIGSTIDHALKNLSKQELKEFFQVMLENNIPNCRIQSISNYKKGDSLCIKLNITSNDFTQRMDDIWLIKSHLINLEALPIMKAKERNFPIWLGGPKSFITKTIWKFPENYSPLSQNSTIVNEIENASAKYELKINENTVAVTGSTIYQGILLPKEKYLEVIKYCKKLQEINNQVIVLRRGK